MFIEDLLKLGRDVDEALLDAAEAAMKEHFRDTVGAGQDPYGQAWPAAADGSRAMPKAYQDLIWSRIGSAVRIDLLEEYVYNNFGAGGSTDSKSAARDLRFRARKRAGEGGKASKFHAPKRQILPDDRGLPPILRDKILALFAKRVRV